MGGVGGDAGAAGNGGTGGAAGAGGANAGAGGAAGGAGAAGAAGAGGGTLLPCNPDGMHPGLVYAGHCYFLSKSPHPGDMADAQCGGIKHGGAKAYAASLETAAENAGVAPVLDTGTGPYWIGLTFDLLAPGQWKWSDGSPFADTEWQPGSPQVQLGLDHVVIAKQGDGSYLWDNRAPAESHVLLCEIDSF